jgi:dihydrofolate reductase
VATKLNTLPKYVASSTLTAPEWAHTTVLAGDLATAVTELKQQPGRELQVHGSGRLARSLHDLGLVDEYRLWVFPVVLGRGQRLFGDGAAPAGLTLVDSQTTSAGVSVQILHPTGPPKLGEIAIEGGTKGRAAG